jgi:hypothetical protein
MKKWDKDRILAMSQEDVVQHSQDLADHLAELLLNEHPGIIAGALILIVGRFFAGHNAEIRDNSFTMFCEAAKSVADVDAPDLWKRAGETP